jgi:hypothetical protein
MNLLLKTLVSLLICSSVIAANHVGIIVKKQGKAELLTNPSSKVVGKGPHVLFEGKYYTLKKVRLGLKVGNGSVVKTGKGAKLKIVYKNGDQFNIGEGTAYRVAWTKKKVKGKSDASTVSLMYGSIRGIVNKKGPRSGMKVKTRHAVMGVRGTDFHIGQAGSAGKSSVSVLRGKVAVVLKPKKAIEVSQGFSAELKKEVKNKTSKKSNSRKAASTMELSKTTKNELTSIQSDSKIVTSKTDEKVSLKVQKELVKLEKKAVENTLSDIKDYDPALYKSLKDKKITNIDEINNVVVAKVEETAPEKRVKVNIDDLDLGANVYDKYFDVE